MTDIIGWILYIICILYSISGLLYSREQVKSKGSISFFNLTILFFTICISLIFALVNYEKFNLIWIIPICVFIGFTSLSRVFGNIMLYFTFFLFRKNYSSLKHIDENQKLDIILEQIESYYQSGDIQSLLELAKKAILIYKDDYRLYSALCRSYKRLLPFGSLDYDSFSKRKIKKFTEHIFNSVKYGEQNVIILLRDKTINDDNLDLLIYALKDLNGSLITAYLLISRINKNNLIRRYITNLNDSLEGELTKYYKKGFEKYDEEFKEYKEYLNRLQGKLLYI